MTIPTTELAERTGISYRRLDHWTRMGWLEADNPNPGHGARRTHPADVVDVVNRVAVLLGIDPAEAFRIARELGDGPVQVGGLVIIDVSEVSP